MTVLSPLVTTVYPLVDVRKRLRADKADDL
jgi:hypothetical protein